MTVLVLFIAMLHCCNVFQCGVKCYTFPLVSCIVILHCCVLDTFAKIVQTLWYDVVLQGYTVVSCITTLPCCYGLQYYNAHMSSYFTLLRYVLRCYIGIRYKGDDTDVFPVRMAPKFVLVNYMVQCLMVFN